MVQEEFSIEDIMASQPTVESTNPISGPNGLSGPKRGKTMLELISAKLKANAPSSEFSVQDINDAHNALTNNAPSDIIGSNQGAPAIGSFNNGPGNPNSLIGASQSTPAQIESYKRQTDEGLQERLKEEERIRTTGYTDEDLAKFKSTSALTTTDIQDELGDLSDSEKATVSKVFKDNFMDSMKTMDVGELHAFRKILFGDTADDANQGQSFARGVRKEVEKTGMGIAQRVGEMDSSLSIGKGHQGRMLAQINNQAKTNHPGYTLTGEIAGAVAEFAPLTAASAVFAPSVAVAGIMPLVKAVKVAKESYRAVMAQVRTANARAKVAGASDRVKDRAKTLNGMFDKANDALTAAEKALRLAKTNATVPLLGAGAVYGATRPQEDPDYSGYDIVRTAGTEAAMSLAGGKIGGYVLGKIGDGAQHLFKKHGGGTPTVPLVDANGNPSDELLVALKKEGIKFKDLAHYKEYIKRRDHANRFYDDNGDILDSVRDSWDQRRAVTGDETTIEETLEALKSHNDDLDYDGAVSHLKVSDDVADQAIRDARFKELGIEPTQTGLDHNTDFARTYGSELDSPEASKLRNALVNESQGFKDAVQKLADDLGDPDIDGVARDIRAVLELRRKSHGDSIAEKSNSINLEIQELKRGNGVDPINQDEIGRLEAELDKLKVQNEYFRDKNTIKRILKPSNGDGSGSDYYYRAVEVFKDVVTGRKDGVRTKVRNIKEVIKELGKEGKEGKRATRNLQSAAVMYMLEKAVKGATGRKVKGQSFSYADFNAAYDEIGESTLKILFKKDKAALASLKQIHSASKDSGKFYEGLSDTPLELQENAIHALGGKAISVLLAAAGFISVGFTGKMAATEIMQAGKRALTKGELRTEIAKQIKAKPELRGELVKLTKQYPALFAAMGIATSTKSWDASKEDNKRK